MVQRRLPRRRPSAIPDPRTSHLVEFRTAAWALPDAGRDRAGADAGTDQPGPSPGRPARPAPEHGVLLRDPGGTGPRGDRAAARRRLTLLLAVDALFRGQGVAVERLAQAARLVV